VRPFLQTRIRVTLSQNVSYSALGCRRNALPPLRKDGFGATGDIVDCFCFDREDKGGGYGGEGVAR
jgi:hypothetical protein